MKISGCLTFGKNYLLFETNFLNEPFNMKDFIFLATTKGYKPILAHPERYAYIQNNMEKAKDLLDRGVLFQINISSITGYYSKIVQTTAHKLIDKGWVHLLGSDCHHFQHVKLVEEAQQMKYFQKGAGAYHYLIIHFDIHEFSAYVSGTNLTWKNMIAITGANGLLGSFIVRKLIEEKISFYCYQTRRTAILHCWMMLLKKFSGVTQIF